MYLSTANINRIFVLVGSLVALPTLTAAQSCFGEATGISEPNWDIRHAWHLRKLMCEPGGCGDGARDPGSPDCTKQLIPHDSYTVMLKGNVTGATENQSDQNCYDQTERIIQTCLNAGYYGGEIPGEYSYTINTGLAGRVNPDTSPLELAFAEPQQVTACVETGGDATSADQCCVDTTFCPNMNKCIAGSHGGSPCGA